MAALVEGRKYGLSSLQSTSAGKSLVHVKLTDSALKAIEEFQKIKDGTSRRPSIQFDDNNGVIRVPIKKSFDNPEGFRQFGFSLSNLLGDLNGSYDCVSASSSGELCNLGSISCKLSVKATDDVYQATKQRMTAAVEESNKQCAKEIKPAGAHISRRIKKVIKRSDVSLPPARDNGPGSSSSPSHLTVKPRAAPPQDRHAAHATDRHSATSGKTHSPQHVPSNPTASRVPGKTHSPQHAPTSQSAPSRVPTNPLIGKTAPNPVIMNQPYRDRIMHLLAIRPYKKPELIIRLQKDGIRERDRNSLGTLLKAVATLSSKDNSFTLNKNLFSEIRQDWPGYSDIDRQLLKRRLAMNESAPASASSPGLSPAHSNSSQGSSPGGSHKRPTSTTDEEIQPNTKRARVAHDRKEAVSSKSHKSSPSPGTSPSSVASQQSKASPVSTKSESPKVTSTTTTESVSEQSKDRSRSHKDDRKHKENHHVSHNNNNNSHKTQKLPATSTSEIPDYCLKYTAIEGSEQRTTYKQEFNEEYEEYRTLHAKVIQVTSKFKELEALLRKSEQGSKDYEMIKQEIVDEYKAVKRNKTYTEERRRCDYLHRKLAHIKKLIVDYDNAQMDLS